MRSWLPMSRAELVAQRPAGTSEDVHFTESLAAAVIEELTVPGDRVLDPFAGYGTALAVAARSGRRAVGVELLADRADAVRRRLGTAAQVVTGDARGLRDLVEGPFELCLTSPPYMTATGHPENPLTAYRTLDGDYRTYLDELAAVFATVAGMLAPGGHLAVNVANVAGREGVTTLAWDLGARIARHLPLRRDVALCWDEQPPGLAGDYLLVFERP